MLGNIVTSAKQGFMFALKYQKTLPQRAHNLQGRAGHELTNKKFTEIYAISNNNNLHYQNTLSNTRRNENRNNFTDTEMPETGEKKSSVRNHKKGNNINEVTVLLGVYRNVQRGLQNSAAH